MSTARIVALVAFGVTLLACASTPPGAATSNGAPAIVPATTAPPDAAAPSVVSVAAPNDAATEAPVAIPWSEGHILIRGSNLHCTTRLFEPLRGHVLDCNAAAAADGDILLTLDVAPDGSVTHASASAGSPAVASCVEAAGRAIAFPCATTDGKPVKVEITFVLPGHAQTQPRALEDSYPPAPPGAAIQRDGDQCFYVGHPACAPPERCNPPPPMARTRVRCP